MQPHCSLFVQVAIDREKMERNSVERQLADRVKEFIDLQARFDAQNAEANARLFHASSYIYHDPWVQLRLVSQTVCHSVCHNSCYIRMKLC